MKNCIRIGTRSSELAIWQANFVKEILERNGYECKLVNIKSDGEIETKLPIYEIGVQGVFTKALDVALLENTIDIAVHSLKDVPTQTAQGIKIIAVPKRGNHKDVIVTRKPINWHELSACIATSSIRRKAQWAYRFPAHTFDNIRGNINTRLDKFLNNKSWDGAVFAAAGLERIDLKVPHLNSLEWMLPAPAQGALGIAAREDDSICQHIHMLLNHKETEIATSVERQFLRALMGGCATPIAAYAEVKGNEICFHGNILTLGPNPQKKELHKTFSIDKANDAGELAANKILQNGGLEIIEEIRRTIG